VQRIRTGGAKARCYRFVTVPTVPAILHPTMYLSVPFKPSLEPLVPV